MSIGSFFLTIGGGSTVAGAMYAGCIAAGRAARPERTKQLGVILSTPSWDRSLRPPAIIRRTFQSTFGESQRSWKCLCMSMAATLAMFVCLTLMYFGSVEHYVENSGIRSNLLIAGVVVCFAFPADYIALWKSRKIIESGLLEEKYAQMFVADIVLSMVISLIVLEVVEMGNWILGEPNKIGLFQSELRTLWYAICSPGFYIPFGGVYQKFWWYDFAMVSTLFTSMWALSIFLAASAIKFLAGVQKVANWMFSVKKRPFDALGCMSGGIVIIVTFVWAVLRALI